MNNNKNVLEEEFSLPPTKRLRSSVILFDWQTQCFFCHQSVVFDSRHPDGCDGSFVRIIQLIDCLTVCEKRNDPGGVEE